MWGPRSRSQDGNILKAMKIVSIYFFNSRISRKELLDILSFSIYPIISMSVFVYLKMPDFQTYNFLPYSDPITSGGYGPNQVSTVFGLGVAILVLGQLLRKSTCGGKYIDLSILILFTISDTEVESVTSP